MYQNPILSQLTISNNCILKILYFLIAFAIAVFIFYLATHQHADSNSVNNSEQQNAPLNIDTSDNALVKPLVKQTLPEVKDTIPVTVVITKETKPDSLVAYAKTLIGTPYKYASTDPSVGFDCSGFITYVFNHYNISVPRSSKDFENTGTEIPIGKSKRGDLILFTGTDSTERVIGHMGIIVSNNKEGLQFIHATSGKAYSVTITPFNKYYQGRFVKTIRVFN